MKPLKIKDLQVGQIYHCLLSDRPVLIVSRETETDKYPDKDSPKETELYGIAFNPATGQLERILVYDDTLIDKEIFIDSSKLV